MPDNTYLGFGEEVPLSKDPIRNDLNRGVDSNTPFLGFGVGDNKAPEDVAGYFPNNTFNTKLDKYITVGDLPDINEERAQMQSGWTQMANGTLKGLGTAATTFATTFTSLPYGILSAAVGLTDPSITAAQAISRVYDNPISRAYDEFSKSMEQQFPNYYTQQEQNASAFSPNNWFTPNFLADKLIKNAGFTIGAIGSGALVGKGLSAIGKLAMSGKYAQELQAVTKLASEYTTQGLEESAAFTKALNEVGKTIKLVNGIQTIGATTIAAGNEATFEGLQTKQQTTQQIIDQFKKKNGRDPNPQELNEIDKYSSAAGNVNYLFNLAILGGSDYIQWGRALSGFKNETKAAMNGITRTGGEYVAEKASKFTKPLIATKGLFTEAAEEGSQTLTQSATSDYFARKYDNPSKDSFADKLNSIGYGLEQTFGTKNGLESMLLGALTGVISGGATGEIRHELHDADERAVNTQNAVDYLNKYSAKDIFLKNEPLIDSAVRAESIGKDMDKAVQSGDIYQFKNLQHDLFKNLVQSRIETGKLDDLVSDLQDLKSLPKEEFEKTWGIDPSTNDKQSTGQYVDNLIAEVKNLGKLKENIDLRFPNLSKDAREALWSTVGDIDNTTKRISDLQLKIAKSPETLMATQNYLNNKSKENLDLLDKIVTNNAIVLESTGENSKQLVQDYILLNNKKQQLAETYKNAITPKGQETLEANVSEIKETSTKEATQRAATKAQQVQQTSKNNRINQKLQDQNEFAEAEAEAATMEQTSENIYSKYPLEDLLDRKKKIESIGKLDSADEAHLEMINDAIAQKQSKVSTPIMITKDMHRQLADLGYSKEDRSNLTPEKANDIITNQQTKPTSEINITKGGFGELETKEQTSTNPKVADIERRRQEELGTRERRTFKDDDGNVFEVQIHETGDKKIVKTTNLNNKTSYPQEYSKELSNDKIYEAHNGEGYEYSAVETVISRGGKKTDTINAKYDAELAELEKQKQAPTQEQKSDADIENKKADIESRRQEAHEQVESFGIKGSGHKTNRDAHLYIDKIYNQELAKLTQPKDEELSTEQTVANTLEDTYNYDSNKEKDIQSNFDNTEDRLEELEGTTIPTEDGGIIYEKSKIRDGHNTVARLDRQYEEVREGNIIKLKEVSNELNPDLFTPILNPDKYQQGTEVTLRVLDRDETPVYETIEGVYVKSTWGAKKGTISSEEVDNVIPVGIYDSGDNLIGYLHDTNWVTEKNVMNPEDDRKNLQDIREYLGKNKEFKTTITGKSFGKLFKTVGNKSITLTEANEDSNIQFGVGYSDNTLKTGKGKSFDGNLVNQKNLVPGATYIIAKVGKDNTGTDTNLAIPVFNSRIEHSPQKMQVISSITTAIQIYLKNEEDYTAEEKKFHDAILDNAKLNIANSVELSEYLSGFINIYNVGKGGSLKSLMENPLFLATKPGVKKSNAALFTINGGNIEFTLTGKTYFISKNTDRKNDEITLSTLSKAIPNMFVNTSINYLDSNKSVVTYDGTNITNVPYTTFLKDNLKTNVLAKQVDEVDGKPIFTYMVQPMIRLDFSSLLKSKESNKKDFTDIISPVNLDKLPDYTKEDIERKVNSAKKSGIINDILESSYNELTAAQIVSKLNLPQTPDNNGDTNRDIVRAVRTYYGIPSLDDMTEFRKWKDNLINIQNKNLLQTSSEQSTGQETIKQQEDTSKLKLDIEKRRQEELSNIILYSVKDIIDMAYNEGAIDVKTKNDYIKYNAGQRIVEAYEGNNTLYGKKISEKLSMLLSKFRFAKDEKISLQDSKEINVKYDAELAKLEEGKDKPKLNFDYIFDLPLTEEQVKGISDTTSKYYIKELGLSKQESLTNSLARVILSKINQNKGQLVTPNATYEEYKTKFESDLKTLQELNDAKYSRIISDLNAITSNWETIVQSTNRKLAKINNIKQKFNDDVDLEDLDNTDNERQLWDQMSYTTDPKSSISKEVKRFLSDIDARNLDGTIKKNFLGLNEVMSFDEVYNALQSMTANLPVTEDRLETIIVAISQYESSDPWIKGVVEKLRVADSVTKAQLVRVMTNSVSNTKFIMWDQNKQNGDYSYVLFDSNSNSVARVLKDMWKGNLIDSSTMTSSAEDPSYKFTDKAKFKITEEFKKITSGNISIEDAKTWAKHFGIELEDKTWEELHKYPIRYNNKKLYWNDLFKKPEGVFKILNDNLIKRGDSSLDQNDIFNDASIEALAKKDSKYKKQVFSNSYRSGGRTIYSYGKNKFLINAVTEITKNLEESTHNGEAVVTSKLLTQKAQLAFNKESIWLNNLLLKDAKGEFIKADNGNYIVNREGLVNNFDYFTADLEPIKQMGTSSKEGRELNNISPAEYEMHKLGLLQASQSDKSGSLKRIVTLLYPTTSDKTTVHGITTEAVKLEFNRDGSLAQSGIDTIYNQMVLPEINRIKLFDALKASGKLSEVNHKEYEEHYNLFYMIPEINNIEGLFDKDGKLNLDVQTPDFKLKIDEVIKSHLEALVKQKLEAWSKYGIGQTIKDANGKVVKKETYLDKRYLDGFKGIDNTSRVKVAATDMIVQYLIGNANSYMMFIGDPAQYFKKDVENTFINIGKRLAGDIAPAEESIGTTNQTYRQIVLADKNSQSLDYDTLVKLIGEEKASKYKSFDGTDAQELTTVLEHLNVMNMYGDGLPTGFYNTVKTTISREIAAGNHYYTQAILDDLNKVDKEWSDLYKHLILQPMKPKYVQNIINTSLGIEKRVYIKSSSYALNPEETRGFEIDKLRIMMEKQGIDRAAFKTAVKVGAPKGTANIWNEDGTIADNVDFSKATLELPRNGFGIQQVVPHDELDNTINRVSQASKNLFINMLNVDGFQFEGKTWKGIELQKRYHGIYNELFKLNKEELFKQLGLDNNAKPLDEAKFISQVRDLLKEEIINRDYPLSDADSLDLDEALTFLSFSPAADKYESLLNSIIQNRIIKTEMGGKSYVVASEEGWQLQQGKSLQESSIKFTKNFKDKLQPNQVIVSFEFLDNNKELLDINNFLDKEGYVDINKIPKEILRGFVMRIPNQGPNSQRSIEIVGFLPHSAGSRMICSRDLVVQMGQDFDVDKLYNYLHNTYYDAKTGNIKLVTEKGNKAQYLQNQILDIHLAIHANEDPRVQKQIKEPLGFWKLPEIADFVYKNSRRFKSDTPFTGMSDEYQKMKFYNATSGKAGVGVYSSLSMFNAIAQGKDLVFTTKDAEGNTTPLEFTIGDETFNGNLSNEYTIKTQNKLESNPNTTDLTYKSDVIAGDQSASVDNEKEQILFKINLNSATFNAKNFLDLAGFEDVAPLLLSQDIIFDYVDTLTKYRSGLEGYTPNMDEVVYKEVMSKYAQIEGVKVNPSELTESKLRSLIKDNTLSENYNNYQRLCLDLFLEADQYGKAIVSVQGLVNTDSKGLEKSLFETNIREENLERLFTSPIRGAERLLGVFDEHYNFIEPTTINGQAIYYGLLNNNKIWNRLFPYKQMFLERTFQRAEELFNKGEKSNTNRADFRRTIWNAVKSYLYSNKDLGLVDTEISADRNRLFIDSETQVTSKKPSLEGQMSYSYGDNKRSDVKADTTLQAIKNGERTATTRYTSDGNIEYWSKAKVGDIISWENKEGDKVLVEVTKSLTKLDKNTSVEEWSKKEGWSVEYFTKKVLPKINEAYQLEYKLVKTTISNKSLGSIIKELQSRTDLQNNPLLTRLNVTPNKNGLPTLIKFNAAAKQNTDEVNIYTSFIDMIVANRSLGEFNGKQYTSRGLAEDLIKYSYLSGGIQQAIEFTKYIPVSYLHSIPFAKKLSDVVSNKLFDKNVYLELPTGKGTPYYQVPNILTQIAQHTPKSLPSVNSDLSQVEVIDGNKKDLQSVKSFALKDSDLYVMRKGYKTPVPSEFITIYDANRKPKGINKNYIFKYSGVNKEVNGKVYPLYEKIDNLGTFGMSEYNSNLQQGTLHTSVLEGNKVNKTVTQPMVIPTTPTSVTSKVVNTEKEVKDVAKELGLVNNGNKKSLLDVLTNISINSEDPYYKLLAEEFLKNSSHIPEDIKINMLHETSRGRWNNDTHVLGFKTSGYTRHQVENTFLHELTHVYLNKYTSLYEQGDMKTLMQLKNPELMKSIKNLHDLFTAYKSTIPVEELTAFNREFQESVTKGIKIPIERLAKYYPALKFSEFITMLTTDKSFQKILNETPYKGDKTFWESIWENITKYFKALGFDVKEHNALATALDDVIYLIKQDYVVKTEEPIEEVTQESKLVYPIETPKEGEKVEVYEEYGTYYKFTLDSNNKVLEGYYSQGNTNNWKVLNVPSSKYKDIIFLHDNINTPIKAEDVLKDNQYKLPSGKVITFNEQQTEAIDKINKWFNNPKEQFFTLSGYAGTGKSTIVKKFIDPLKGVAVSAPTHKARKVIEKTTNKKGFTIQALLGLRPNTEIENFDINNPQFDPKAEKLIGDYKLVVIDEASMLNKDLYNLLIEEASLAGTKILFMGDKAQIPPIKEKISKVFSDVPSTYNLTKVERTKDSNPLVKIFDTIRNNISNSGEVFKHQTEVNYNGEGVIFLTNRNKFGDEAVKYFTSEKYKEDGNFAKIIAWTNQSVQGWNNKIRTSLFRENAMPIEEGEIMMAYNTIEGDPYMPPRLENSADYKILGVTKVEKGGIKGYNIKYDYIEGDEALPYTLFIVDKNDKPSLVKFLQEHDRLLEEAKSAPSHERGKRWAMYYQYKKQYLLQENIMDSMGRLLVKKDIDYGYAITGHKSQGSTYNNVFIVEDDIDKNLKIEERNQIKYVAFSRASEKVFSLSTRTVDEKYSEKIVDSLPSKEDLSTGEKVDELLPSTISKQEVLQNFKELNADGTQKHLPLSDSNYRVMFDRAKNINNSQPYYKATVGKILGEGGKREFYSINLEPRSETNLAERAKYISEKEVLDRIKFCK